MKYKVGNNSSTNSELENKEVQKKHWSQNTGNVCHGTALISEQNQRTCTGQSNTANQPLKRHTPNPPKHNTALTWAFSSISQPGMSTGNQRAISTQEKNQAWSQTFSRVAASVPLLSDKDHHSPLLFQAGSKIPPSVALERNKLRLLEIVLKNVLQHNSQYSQKVIRGLVASIGLSSCYFHCVLKSILSIIFQ